MNTCNNKFPSNERVMAELESDRADGTLAATVTEAETKYEAVEGEIGLIREIRSDGSSRLGVVVDGKFVP